MEKVILKTNNIDSEMPLFTHNFKATIFDMEGDNDFLRCEDFTKNVEKIDVDFEKKTLNTVIRQTPNAKMWTDIAALGYKVFNMNIEPLHYGKTQFIITFKGCRVVGHKLSFDYTDCSNPLKHSMEFSFDTNETWTDL